MSRHLSINKILLTAEGSLGRVAEHAMRLHNIEKRIIELLPGSIRQHTLLADHSAKSLTLVATTAAVAARLRYLEPDLIRQLNNMKGAGQLEQIKVVIASQRGTSRPGNKTGQPVDPKPFSGATRELLEQTGKSVRNPRLAAALLKLSGKGQDQAAE